MSGIGEGKPSRYRMSLTAWLEKGSGADYGYISGYKKAADVLVKDLEDGSHEQDFLVYPIFFLYRHHVELSLKRIVRKGKELFDEPIDVSLKKELDGHSVGPLWQAAKVLLDRVEQMPTDMAANIQEAIDFITKLDSNSFAFRYSTTKAGGQSLRDAPHTIQIEKIAEVFTKASWWLFAAFDQINYQLDLKSDELGFLKDAADDFGYDEYY